jgi:hypothetical protein
VLVDARPAVAAAIAGHTLRIGLAPPPQVMCDEIGPGELTIELTRAAGLGNPAVAGTYAVTATVAGAAFAARFTLQAA